MIRFPYLPFAIPGAGTASFVTIHRPIIPIHALGTSGKDELRALVDTGADDTMLPDSLIDQLGVVIQPGDHAIIIGIEGSKTVARFGTVDLEIPGPGGGYRWSARVGFHAGFRIVLGHVGFLEYFTATFNGRSRQLTLTPNGSAPAPASSSP